MGGHAGRLVKGVTVELEVCDGRERGAAGEDRALVVSLRREDVGAQVAPVVLGRETGGKVGANVIHSAVTVALGAPATQARVLTELLKNKFNLECFKGR